MQSEISELEFDLIEERERRERALADIPSDYLKTAAYKSPFQ